MTLIIPDSCAETGVTAEPAPAMGTEPSWEGQTAAEESTTPYFGEVPSTIPAGIADRSRITTALILPFMTSRTEKGKEAKASADFYRGFMLAVDSLKRGGSPMTVIAYDSDQSPEKLKELLESSDMRSTQAIIAPDGESFETVAEFGRARGIDVFNVFNTKDTSFQTNPYLFQANIPYDIMVDKAGDYLTNIVGNATVVVLRPRNNVDKIEVVENFTRKLKANNKQIVELTFADKLTAEELSRLPKDQDYIFIPTTAKATPTTEILAAIEAFKESGDGIGRVSVFGYPEWTVLKGKALEHMKNVNASFYSRFFDDNSEFADNAVEEAHQRWYGFEMPAGVPRMTLTGFDTAMFLIKALQANKGDFSSYSPNYSGEQNPYHFVRSSADGGWYNDCMYVITYRPSGMIEKIAL